MSVAGTRFTFCLQSTGGGNPPGALLSINRQPRRFWTEPKLFFQGFRRRRKRRQYLKDGVAPVRRSGHAHNLPDSSNASVATVLQSREILVVQWRASYAIQFLLNLSRR